MNPKGWRELKSKIINKIEHRASGEALAYKEVADWMEEIEKCTLLERVAYLIRGFDLQLFLRPKTWSIDDVLDIIEKALLSGDTSELEKWQKEKA